MSHGEERGSPTLRRISRIIPVCSGSALYVGGSGA
jgi:hypothetical protein